MIGLEVVDEKRREFIEKRLLEEKLFAVIGTKDDIADNIPSVVRELRSGGVSIAEVTCRAQTWLKHLEALRHYRDNEDEEVIVAVGTNTDIFSVHQAMENGAEVIVAAHGLEPYQNQEAIPVARREYIDELNAFIYTHREPIQEYMYSIGDNRKYEEFMYDPIWYVKARGGIVIPAASRAPDGLKALRARGADFQKLYPTKAKLPEEWKEVFKAVTPQDDLRVVLTGGLKLENLADYMNIPYVVAAGMSYIVDVAGQGETYAKTRKCVEIVKGL